MNFAENLAKLLLAAKKPPKKYRETGAKSKSDYADPENYKYPIHTEKNVRSALSYFSNPKNYKKYSPSKRSSVWSKIKSAAKKYKIKLNPDNDPPWKKKKKKKKKKKAFLLSIRDKIVA